jgi:hypothetical protein
MYNAAVQDELDVYLASDPKQVADPLKWWDDRCDCFPNLSRMARDYLAIPGMLFTMRICLAHSPTATSTDVERLFSRGRLLLSHLRNRLSAESTCALMCLGSWSLMGFIKDEDILDVIMEKTTVVLD